MKNFFITLIILFLTHLSSWAQSVDIQHVEPPFWWVDMTNENLQIMIHGDDIASHRPKIVSDKVIHKSTHFGDCDDYIFLDLEVEKGAEAGVFNIDFFQNEEKQFSLDYELKARVNNARNIKGFDQSDVMYLITPDRFANGDPENDEIEGMMEGLKRDAEYGRHGGDIQGITDRLEYIDEMGFTAIWLNPLLENDQHEWSYHGYATTDYYRVDSRFGTNEDYLELCQKAREKGIGVIMDIIVNHCGSHHWWMKDPPFSDWINRQDLPYQETNHRKNTLLDPHVSKADRDRMVKGWFVPAMPDLNQRNPFMSTYLIQNSIWWIEYLGLAGIRQDTYSYPFREFMTDWTCAIMDEYPDFNIVGEEWTDNQNIIAYWQRDKVNHDGYTSCLPSQMDFPLTSSLHRAMNEDEGWGSGLMRLYDALSNDFIYAHAEDLVVFPDNHDMSRIFTQVNENIDLFNNSIAFILTTRGTPQLYYGTEILMSNKGTDSHGIIRSDFPGGWAGDNSDAISGKNISSEAIAAQGYIKKLLNWRKSQEVIHYGKLLHFVPDQGAYVYFRYDDTKKVMVILNKNKEDSMLDLSRFREILKSGEKGHEVISETQVVLNESLALKAMTPMIIELD
jgi:glycosidase